ncbi:type IX secretion/gliding motility protein PorT/SprT [Jiulongibacter sp. NS-SX5]|uniref:type IX secretion/gliding motility protein PorT/SprT n=1 Tax=Jiulongibacter sp. NS-SX5 TaxID=3463854 RepID=UPI004058E7BB
MLGVCWNKIGNRSFITSLSFVLFLLSVNAVFGQARSKIIYQSEYDAKQLHFGYFMGVAMSNFRLKFNSSYTAEENTQIQSITSPIDYGIKMGGLMNFYVNPRFDVKFLPTVAIYSRKIEVNQDPDQVPSREQAWFEVPLLLKYKSLRRGNMRMNMFVGMRQGFETNAINLAKKTNIDKLPGLRRADLSVEYGAGMELFRQFFKLAPEVHFSHGIRNMIDKADVPTTEVTPLTVLDRLNTHTVTFYLFFE